MTINFSIQLPIWAWAAVWLWGFYLLYAFVMGVYRAHLARRLNWKSYILLSPGVLLGLVVDLVTNIVMAAVDGFIYGEWTVEFLVTTRLTRYKTSATKYRWRYRMAWWICTDLLDPLDPTGPHC